jgi:hypothetical protein
MSAANEIRLKLGKTLFTIGVLLILVSYLSHSTIAGFAQLIGIALASCGTFIAIPILVINFASWLPKFISNSAHPKWEGDILHTDGSAHKIRYVFDSDGSPRFVANDVCIAIGNKPPTKGILKWAGVDLVIRGENTCFTEATVQEFLTPLAAKNPDANRLLILIRNNVLRKLEKKRDDDKRLIQTPELF